MDLISQIPNNVGLRCEVNDQVTYGLLGRSFSIVDAYEESAVLLRLNAT